MKPLLSTLTAALLAQGVDTGWVERLAFWIHGDVQRLTQRIDAIDRTVSTLPELTMINSSTRVGLKTNYETDEDEIWLELALAEPALVDSVVLVPPLAKAANAVVAGYGFPLRFRITVFDAQDRATVVREETARDFPNPGCNPIVARFAPIPAARVRFTATKAWTRDGPQVLALAEMLVLSGERNLALDARATSSSVRNLPWAWARANLSDMATPLGLPVAPQLGGRLGFHSAVAEDSNEQKSVTITLPRAVALDEVRIVPVRRRDVPLWFSYGFPLRFKVETATEPDFRDAFLLYEWTNRLQPAPGMNLVCIPGQHRTARYLRITATQLWERRGDYVFALAEVQAIAGNENVALGASVTASDALDGDLAWSPAALTDGWTGDGRLLPLTRWFTQLEQRRALEEERAQLAAARTTLLERAQRTLVQGSVNSVGGISLLSGLLLWRQRRLRRREAQLMHDKLARDLHDEIGSNLGSITLICSFANQSDATLETLRTDLAEIERVAGESAHSMRDMVALIGPRRTAESRDWFGVLHGLTERLLRGVTLDCALPSAPLPAQPDLETRRELYLFCKEVLHNISRHARATAVRFHLAPTARGLRIEISDDGIGFDPGRASSGQGLGNLRERAVALGAALRLDSQPGAGTTVQLDVPKTARWLPT